MLEHWIRRRSRALFGVCAFTTFILFCLKYVYLGELEIPNGGIAGGPGARTRLLDLPLVPQLPQRVADENMVAYEQMQPETADSERVRFYMTRRSDVMVFLHIQKTGGTVFERHLIKDLDIEHPCVPGPGRKRWVSWMRVKLIYIYIYLLIYNILKFLVIYLHYMGSDTHSVIISE